MPPQLTSIATTASCNLAVYIYIGFRMVDHINATNVSAAFLWATILKSKYHSTLFMCTHIGHEDKSGRADDFIEYNLTASCAAHL